MKEIDVNVEGMSCGRCVQHVRDVLCKLQGVEVEHVEIGRVRVKTNPDVVPPRDIEKAITDAGYPAKVAS